MTGLKCYGSRTGVENYNYVTATRALPGHKRLLAAIPCRDSHGYSINFRPRSLPPLPGAIFRTTMKAGSSKLTKKNQSVVGAPSQLSQSTRKGKKAWRKNVDINNVEEGLETIRSEERVLGTALHNQPDKDLFTVDVTGDAGGEFVRTLPNREANYLRHSQAEVTKVLQGPIDFNENPISEIRRSRCQLTRNEETPSQLQAEGKTVADNSTPPARAVQCDHRSHRVWSW